MIRVPIRVRVELPKTSSATTKLKALKMSSGAMDVTDVNRMDGMEKIFKCKTRLSCKGYDTSKGGV